MWPLLVLSASLQGLFFSSQTRRRFVVRDPIEDAPGLVHLALLLLLLSPGQELHTVGQALQAPENPSWKRTVAGQYKI